MNTAAPSRELSLEQMNNDPFAPSANVRYDPRAETTDIVEFYMAPQYQEAESKLEGRKIYKDTEYIKILIPGDKSIIIDEPAIDMYKQRYPQHYARFKAGQAEQIIGTPLSEVTFIEPSKAKEYEFFHIRTVEQLANASDGSDAGQRMMGFHADKQKAIGYLEVAKGNAPIAALESKLEESNNTIANLQSQINELMKRSEKAAKKPE